MHLIQNDVVFHQHSVRNLPRKEKTPPLTSLMSSTFEKMHVVTGNQPLLASQRGLMTRPIHLTRYFQSVSRVQQSIFFVGGYKQRAKYALLCLPNNSLR